MAHTKEALELPGVHIGRNVGYPEGDHSIKLQKTLGSHILPLIE